MKAPTLRYVLPPRIGTLSLVWDKEKVIAKNPTGQLSELNSSQRKIVEQLNASQDGLLAAELSKNLGKTHAGVLFLLQPLLENGIVERVVLRGGGVLYYMPFRISVKLSREMEDAKTSIEVKAGKPVQEMTLEELYENSKGLEDTVKKPLFGWIFEGGWKK